MRKVNPSVKAAAVMAAAVLTAFCYSVFWNLVIIAFCFAMMLLSRADLKKLAIVMIPVTLVSVSLFVSLLMNGGGSASTAGRTGTGTFINVIGNTSSFSIALAIALRMYAFAFMGMLFVLTTGANEFLYSLMQQLHVKPKYAYGVMAAFHLVPLIQREIRQIRLAYRVRGCRSYFKGPLFTALVNSLHWSESLAMAMESKGFEEEGARTYYLELKVRPTDIVWAAVLIGIALCGALGLVF